MALGHSVFAQPQSNNPQWNKFQTKHFTVIGNADPAKLRATAVRLEQFRTSVLDAFGAKQNDPIETRVVVFRDVASFRPFRPKRSDGTSDDLVSGQFHSGNDVNYISAADDGKQISTLFHEYVHDVLERSFGKSDIPTWLNEGLAEFFQGFQMGDGGYLTVGLPDRSHLSILRRRPLIPWKEFFAKDDLTLLQSSDDARLVFYAQAWALTNALVRSQMAVAVNTGKRPADLQSLISPGRIVRESSGYSSEKLDAAVRDLVATIEDRPSPINIRIDPVQTEPRVSQLSEAEVNGYLGDLAFRARDLVAAESYLMQSISISPALALANSSLGLLRLNQRKFAEAGMLFEKAISADSENFLIYFYSAYLISKEYTDEFGSVSQIPDVRAAKMRTHLRRAVALNPSHSESYKLLAIVSLVNGDEVDSALVAIKKAIDLRPVNQEYRLIASQVLLRLERLEEAKKTAADVLSSTKDKFLIGEAEDVVKSADEFMKARSESGNVLVRLDGSIVQKPLILQYKDLTDDDVKRIDSNREITNLNRLIERPRHGEKQEVGRIEQIKCSSRNATYMFRSGNRLLRLAGTDFEGLRIKVLLNGAHSFTFRCDASFSNVVAVVVYRPFENTSIADGEFVSAAFVPDHFRLKTLDELTGERQVIIEGRKQSDLAANAKEVEVEQKEFDRQMRETQLRNIQERLRELRAGERRILATPEKLECVDGRIVVHAVSQESRFVFSTQFSNKPEVVSFTPNTGILELGCRTQLPPVTAVITYRDDRSQPGRNELIAIEFVPSVFKLN